MLLSKRKFWMSFAVVSMILIACIGLGESIHMIARVHAENQVTYVEDIRVITASKGKSEDAEEWCREYGYVFTGIDLNEKSGENKNAYLCYKETDTPSKAITEIRAVVMDEGYSLYNYEELVEQLQAQNSGTAQTMYNASQEFIEKYNQGSPKAKDAYEGLNLFYVSDRPKRKDILDFTEPEETDDEDVEKLGDYILAGKADQAFYIKVIIQSSAFALNMVMTLLNIGVAAYENDLDEETQSYSTANWGEMLEESNLASVIDDDILTTDEMDELDQKYNDIARDIFEQVQSFTTNYQNAVTYFEEQGVTEDYSSLSTGRTSRSSDKNGDDDAEEATTQIDASETAADAETEAEADAVIEEEADGADDGGFVLSADAAETDDAAEAEDEAFDYSSVYEGYLNDVETEAEIDTDTEDSEYAYYIEAFVALNQYYYREDTKLGDWLVDLGLQTSEDVNYRVLYPLIEAMGTVQANVVCLTGMTSATYNLNENEMNESLRTGIDELKQVIKDYNGNDNDSLDLFESADQDYEDAKLGFTSENIRKTQASNSIGVISDMEKLKNKVSYVMKWFGLVMSCLTIVVGVLKLISTIMSLVSGVQTAWWAVSSATFIMGLISTAATTAMSWIGGITLILTAITIIVFVVMYIIYVNKKTINHSDYPNYLFDSVDGESGYQTIRYSSVRGDTREPLADPTDINVGKQYKWEILEQTQDRRVGSPIVVTKDSAGNDITFKSVLGDNSSQQGYDCVKLFGNTGPTDLNTCCEDKEKGLYLHYTTEESTGQATPADKETESADDEDEDEEKNYIGDLIVSIGDDASEAKAGITSHSGKFYIFDYNFSPSQDFATYIGYSITTDPDAAFTDLRVATLQGTSSDSSSITYGDVKYTRIGTLGYYTDPSEKGATNNSDALYYTKDENAGEPILADTLKAVTDVSKLRDDGFQPVTFFGNDIAYNWDTCYDHFSNGWSLVNGGGNTVDSGSKSNYITWYGSQEDHGINDTSSTYLCYEPETKYTEGTKYLSGIFFYGGHDWEDTTLLSGDIVTDVSEFTEKLEKDPRVVVNSSLNLAKPIYELEYMSWLHFQCYFGYTWSYNPKRAITHAWIYQGDSYSQYSTTMNYSVSKTNINTGSTVNYVAATFLNQGASCDTEYLIRYPDQSNCFRFFSGMTNGESNLTQKLYKGYTKTLPNDIDFGWEKHCYLPTAMYVSGHQDDVSGLTLDDVVATTNEYDGTTVDLSGETTLGGSSASGSFYPVVDMKNPHETEPFNLGYPDFYSQDGDLYGRNQPYYLYIKGSREAKKTYISSISVGSYSRDKYEESNGESEDSTLQEVDKIVNNTAMIAAATGGADETIVYNFATDSKDQDSAWYNYADYSGKSTDVDYGKAKRDAPNDMPAAYLSVTRTDSKNDAITGILLWKSDATTAGNTMTYNNVKYTCAGNSYPVLMNGERYFVYYTKNIGVSPGKPIEDIKIDNTPIIAGYATNLCGDDDHDEPYGNPDQTAFIHMKYTPDNGDFFNKLYVARGATKRAAQCDLLTQGCNEFIDLDINSGIPGDSMYCGFRKGTIDWDSVNGKSTEAKQQQELESQTQEAVYDVVVTCNEEFHPDGFVSKGMFYYPASSNNLNDENGDEMYMYIATPWYSARYNKNYNADTDLPQDVYSGYYSSLAFAQNDRVPYNTSQSSEGSSSVTPWEYIMLSTYVDHADFNSGQVNFDRDAGYAKECRIHMFGQRTDGSVKPAGEITGGFLEAQYDVGEILYN